MGIFSKKPKVLGEDITNLKIGTAIEISKLEDKEYKFVHSSKLEEFISNNELLILVPISKGMLVKLSQNIKYTIIFKTKKGLFKNVMKIQEYIVKDELPFMRIKLLEETKKIQRRQCFRFDTNIDFKFEVIGEKGEEVEEKFYSDEPVLSVGKTVDISNGGMKFLSNEQLKENDLIKIEFILNEKLMYILGNILHSEESINKLFNLKYSYKVKFEIIDKYHQEYISKYILEQQKILSKSFKLRND